MLAPRGSAQQRFEPRPWHGDWLALRQLRQTIERLLPTVLDAFPDGGTVLDFGAGTSPYRRLFEGYRDLTYLTCDLAGEVDLTIRPDGTVPLADGAVDTVVSFQVLEHVPSVDTYLGECHRLLRPGGHLLLSTHGTWLYHPHPTDYRRWTPMGLRQEVEARGFSVASIDGCVGPLAWTTMFRLLGFEWGLRRIPLVGPALAGLLALAMNCRALVEDHLTPPQIRFDNASVFVVLAQRRPD